MVVEATTLKLKCVRWCAVVAGAIYRYALSLGDFTSGGELCVEGSGAAAADEQDLAQTVGVPSISLSIFRSPSMFVDITGISPI